MINNLRLILKDHIFLRCGLILSIYFVPSYRVYVSFFVKLTESVSTHEFFHNLDLVPVFTDSQYDYLIQFLALLWTEYNAVCSTVVTCMSDVSVLIVLIQVFQILDNLETPRDIFFIEAHLSEMA